MEKPTVADLEKYRWWTFAKTEEEALLVLGWTWGRNAALGLPHDHGLEVAAS